MIFLENEGSIGGKFGNIRMLIRRFSSARPRTAPRGPKLGAASINLMLRSSTIHRTACSFLSIRALKSPSRARRCRAAAAVNPQMSECRTGAEGSDFYLRWSPAGSRRRNQLQCSAISRTGSTSVRAPCVLPASPLSPFALVAVMSVPSGVSASPVYRCPTTSRRNRGAMCS